MTGESPLMRGIVGKLEWIEFVPCQPEGTQEKKPAVAGSKPAEQKARVIHFDEAIG